MAQLEILAVGDMVTDTFIRLLEDQAAAYENDHGKWLAMPFGAKLPFDHAEVNEAAGNAANAAVSFARLGLKTGLVSNVGGDSAGRDMITALQKEQVDSRYVHINPDKRSNHNFVLWYKEERTILVKHEDYDYHWPKLKPSEVPAWIYFSSISEHALQMHDDLAEWLEEKPAVKLAFQPGTFQITAGTKRLSRLYARTEVLLVNREEAVQVSGGNKNDIHDLLDKLHDLGPKIVVITDGPNGSYASDGQDRLKMPAYPDPAPPLERTGAGDAYSSTFVAELVRGNSIEGALQAAPINSMNVVQHVGSRAGLLTKDKLDQLLEQAPPNYEAEKL